MTLGLAYWIIMLIWLLFGLYTGYNLMLFVLLVLIGWKIFGPPLHA